MSELNQPDVVKVLRESKWVMMTTARSDGKLLSHPMTPQEVTDDADVWFFASRSSDHADVLRQGGQVNLASSEAGEWLSVSGRAEFVEDRAKIDELWSNDVEAWFPGGKDDPDLGLLLVVTNSAQFWGTPGGKVAALAQIVKSRVTGDRPAGDSDTTAL